MDLIARGISGIGQLWKRKTKPALATAGHPWPREKAFVPPAPGPFEVRVTAARAGRSLLSRIAAWLVIRLARAQFGLGRQGGIFNGWNQPKPKTSRTTS
jgi:hypothetical protein